MVTVGFIEGGEAGNVIPETVKFGGTYRSLSPQGLSYIQERIKEVNICSSLVYSFPDHSIYEADGDFLLAGNRDSNNRNTTVEFKEETPLPYLVLINDEALYEHAKMVGEVLLGKQNVQILPVTMGAEDFSFYSQRMPAVMFTVGTKNETLKSDCPLHSPHFTIDEEALQIGSAFHAAVAISYLDRHGETH